MFDFVSRKSRGCRIGARRNEDSVTAEYWLRRMTEAISISRNCGVFSGLFEGYIEFASGDLAKTGASNRKKIQRKN
jgi:hypothetical protein